jgi:hypothetical protein
MTLPVERFFRHKLRRFRRNRKRRNALKSLSTLLYRVSQNTTICPTYPNDCPTICPNDKSENEFRFERIRCCRDSTMKSTMRKSNLHAEVTDQMSQMTDLKKFNVSFELLSRLDPSLLL